MDQVELEITLPPEVAALLGETDEQRGQRARQALLLHLLREGRITQSQAAELLGITIHDVIDLMARYDIPSGPRSIGELLHEVEAVERVLRNQAARRKQA